jgi:hypothetical protein
MVSRETTVHVISATLAIAIFVLFSFFGPDESSQTVSALLFVVVYGLMFGGGHFYLALRGEDGVVPVKSRWRFIGLLVVYLGAGAVSLSYGNSTVASIQLNTIVFVVVVTALVVYLVVENVDAYRESLSE